MNRTLLTRLASTTCILSVASLAYGDPVEQNLEAKITLATGIFDGLVDETVQVRIVYDDDMVEGIPGGPIADIFTTEDPMSNGAFDIGVEVSANGIVRSTIGKGEDGMFQHRMDIVDEPQQDEWSIATTNFFDPVNGVSITLRGDGSYVRPGSEGLNGMPVFPPDYCATGDSGVETATGTFNARDGQQFEGQINFDFLEGPACSGGSGSLCGDANDDGMVSATDALLTLAAGIGSGMCMPCLCDVDDSGTTSATDALAILQASVGTPVPLNCPAC